MRRPDQVASPEASYVSPRCPRKPGEESFRPDLPRLPGPGCWDPRTPDPGTKQSGRNGNGAEAFAPTPFIGPTRSALRCILKFCENPAAASESLPWMVIVLQFSAETTPTRPPPGR
jgi:hypothetical protein